MDSQLAVILLTGYRENRPGSSTRPAYCSESVPLQFGGKREPNILERALRIESDLKGIRRYKRGGFHERADTFQEAWRQFLSL